MSRNYFPGSNETDEKKGATHMTRTERTDLLQICRQRERVARAEADAVAARRRAEFQSQLARIYSWDKNDIWKAATKAAKEFTRECSERITAECDKLGIPRRFQPQLGEPQWWGRGENAVAERRAELTKVANTRIDQHLKETIHAIQRHRLRSRRSWSPRG